MRWKVIAVVAIVVCAVIGIFLWRAEYSLRRWDSATRRLADGTKIVLSGVRIGRTNIYTHGTFLSKTIGRFASTNGLTIARHKIEPPTKITIAAWDPPTEQHEVLTAELRLFPRTGRQDDLVNPPFHRKHRIVISGNDGFDYVQEFTPFKQQVDGLFSFINAQRFPRTSQMLSIRLEERNDQNSREFREAATFIVKNPKPAKIEQWKAQESPRLKLGPDVEVEVGELVVHSGRIHPMDIWENMATLSLRFTSSGSALTNWGIHDTKVRDASGNFDFFSASKTVTNDRVVYHAHRPLDPAQPWWFDANFALDADFPPTNLFSFTVPYPMTTTMETNFGPWLVRISYVNTDMLAVELPQKPANLRLTYVSARDESGKSLYEGSGSWSQHRFWRMLSVRDKRLNVNTTIAIHPNHTNTFILKPARKPTGDRRVP